MVGKYNAYLLIFRDKKQHTDLKKICRVNRISMRFVLQKLIDEFIMEKRNVGLIP